MTDKFSQQGFLSLSPDELFFENVRFQQFYKKVIHVTNHLTSAVEATIRAGSPDRYSVSPTSLRLRPGESCEIEVRLKIFRFAQRTKAMTQGIRDVFHIKSAFFDQKFHATFFLGTDDETGPAPATQQPEETRTRSVSAGRAPVPPSGASFFESESQPRTGAGVRIPHPRARSATPPSYRPGADAASPPPPAFEEVFDGDAAFRAAMDRRLNALDTDNRRLARELETARKEAADQGTLCARLKDRVQSLRFLAGVVGKGAEAAQLESATPVHKQLDMERVAKQALVSKTNELEGQVAILRTKVRELESDNVSLRDENVVLRRLQDELNRSSPDVTNLIEVSLAQERAKHESRSRKVLEMLRAKDEELDRLEAVATESDQRIRETKLQLVDTLSRLDESERRVQELLEGKIQMQRQFDASVQEGAREKALLRAELSAVQAVSQDVKTRAADAASSTDRAEIFRAELLNLKAEVDVKTQTIKDREAEIAELRRRLHGQGTRFADSEGRRAEALQAANTGVTRTVTEAEREVHELRARVEELEGMVQRQSRDPQSLGGGAASLRASLEAKVVALEAANRRLEQSLLESARAHWTTAPAENGTPAALPAHSNLREMLAQKEATIGGLLAEVAALRATLNAPGAPRIHVDDWVRQRAAMEATCSNLRVQLMDREALLDAADGKIASLETQLRAGVPPITGGRRSAAAAAARESVEHGLAEAGAQAARSAAIRLNARVSELALSEQQARSEAQALRSELEALKRDVVARAATSALSSSMTAKGSGGGEDDEAPFSGVVSAKHLEDAEVAVADMHGRLLDALEQKRKLEDTVRDLQHQLEIERGRAEAKMRALRDDGSARIAGLEEAVRVLGSRSDMHREVARLHGEVTALRRAEQRAKSDSDSLKADCEDLQRQLADARAEIVLLKSERDETEVLEVALRRLERDRLEEDSELAVQGNELKIIRQLQRDKQKDRIRLNQQVAKGQQQIAELQRELEAKKKEAATFKAQLDALRDKRRALGMENEGAGASPKKGMGPRGNALASMAELDRVVMAESRATELQGRVALQLTELATAREELEAREVEVETLKVQLSEMQREVQDASVRAGESERAAHDAREQAARREVANAASASAELANASRRAVEAERQADRSTALRGEAEDKLRAKELEFQRSRIELETTRRDAELQIKRLQEQVQQAINAAMVSRKESERAMGEAEERKVQVTVLMETVETLQAGNASEKDQRIVVLTSQLATSRAAEVALDRRCAGLLVDIESKAQKLQQADEEIATLRMQVRERDARGAAQRGTADMLEQEVAALRQDVKTKSEEAAALLRELDAQREAARRLDAEAQGLRATIESVRRRHHDQLSKERGESAEQLRALKEENLRLVTSGGDGGAVVYSALSGEIQELIALVKGRGGKEDESDATAALEDLQWRTRVFDRFKSTVLAAERARGKAEVDARIAQGQAADYLTRWKEAESALDRALSSWEIAEGARAAEAAGFARALDVRASQTEEKMRLKDRQLGALSDALDKTSRRLIEAEAQLRVAKEALSQESSRLETVQRRARLLEVDCREAEGRVAALIMEHAGTDQVDLTSSLMMPDAIARRDLGIKTYFEQEVVKLLLATDPREKVLGLTRELCGIKVVESQLLASLAAARRRADVLCAQSCSLKEINQSLENKLQAIRDSRESSSAGASESASSLSAQLSARTSEAFRLQDELLTCQQRLQTRDLRCDELEREKARLEELASRSRVEGEGQVNRLREELSKAHAAQVAILSRDIDVARQRHVDAVRQLRSELQHCAQQAAEEKRAAIDRVTSERPDPADFSALQAEAEQQRAKLQEAEDALRRLQEENGVLLADLKAIERDNMELRDDRDTRGRALEELERTLTSIERAAERAASSTAGRAAVFGTRGTAASAKAGPCGRTSPSPRCGASGAAAGDTAAPNGPGALAELSRQLVQSKMSAADAERRLRLSARSELELRTQLKKREERIEELRRQLMQAELAAKRSGRSLPAPPGGRHSRAGSFDEAESEGGPAEAGPSKPAQPREIASLKSELARREAQIEHLEVSLAQAIAGARDREDDLERFHRTEAAMQERLGSVDRYKRELHRLHEAVQGAVTSAHAVLSLAGLSAPTLADAARGINQSPRASYGGSPGDAVPTSLLSPVLDEVLCHSTIERLNTAVSCLVSLLKEKDTAVKKSIAKIKALEASVTAVKAEAFGAPIEASQRAVIRDLTQRCNQLAHEKAELKAEAEVLRKQLSTLRGSLGSHRSAGAHVAIAESYEAAVGPAAAAARGAEPGPASSAGPSAAATLPSEITARNGPEAVGEAKGLIDLLAEHMSIVKGYQQRINEVATRLTELRLTGGPGALTNAGSGGPVGRLFIDESSRQSLVDSSLQIATELQSMESALRLLSADMSLMERQIRAATGEVPPPEVEFLTGELEAVKEREAALQATLEEAKAAQEEECEGLREQTERWRNRCDDLHRQLEEVARGAAEAEQALRERIAHADRDAQEEIRRLKLESSKMEAQLAGAEAARKELLQQAAAAEGGPTRARPHEGSLPTGDLIADLTSKLASSEGRLAVLEQQASTQRTSAQAQISTLQEECEALRESLEKERQERSRLVSSLRETVSGLRQVGGEEERLRLELVRAQEALVSAQERQAQSQARIQEKRKEVKVAKTQFRSLQDELQRKVLDAEQRSVWVEEEVSRMRRAFMELEGKLMDLERRRTRLETDLIGRIESTIDQVLRSADTSAPDAILRELEAVERMSTDLEARCRHLEAELDDERARRAAVEGDREAEARRADKYKEALKDAKREGRRKEEELTERARALEGDVLAGRQQLESLRSEADELRRGLVRLAEEAEDERRALVDKHRAALQDLDRRMDAERETLMQQSKVVSHSLEERSRQVAESTIGEVQARAEAAIKVYRLQLESLSNDFRSYQQAKGREIAQLEAQLEEALGAEGLSVRRRARPVSSGALDGGATGASEGGSVTVGPVISDTFPGVPLDPAYTGVSTSIRQALEVEGLAAARREITLERLLRTKAEAEVQSLRKAIEDLTAKAKDASKEAKQLRMEAAQRRDQQEETARVESEAAELREQLRTARKEIARRTREAQSLQQRLEGITPLGPVVPVAQLEAERELKEASDSKARALRAEVERKDALVASLRKKLEESTGREAREAELQERLQVAESRVRQLQSDLQRKSLALDQTKSKLDEAQRAADELSAKDDGDRAALKKARSDLARKDGALAQCHKDLEAAKGDLASARQSLEEAGKRESLAARSMTRDYSVLRRRALDLLSSVKGISKLVLRATAATTLMADALQTLEVGPRAPTTTLEGEAAAAATTASTRAASVAKMLGMDPSEVLTLLGAAEGRGPGTLGAQAAGASSSPPATFSSEAAARMASEASRAVSDLLHHVEVALASGVQSSAAREVVAQTSGAAAEPEWRPELLATLVDGLEKEQAMAEGRISSAIARISSSASSARPTGPGKA